MSALAMENTQSGRKYDHKGVSNKHIEEVLSSAKGYYLVPRVGQITEAGQISRWKLKVLLKIRNPNIETGAPPEGWGLRRRNPKQFSNSQNTNDQNIRLDLEIIVLNI